MKRLNEKIITGKCKWAYGELRQKEKRELRQKENLAAEDLRLDLF